MEPCTPVEPGRSWSATRDAARTEVFPSKAYGQTANDSHTIRRTVVYRMELYERA